MALKVKKILVSQPKPTAEKSPYFDIMEKYKVKIDFRPFIKIEAIDAKEFRKQRVSILDHTAIVFNARHGIDHFFRLCEELRVTVPEDMKYFCVSESVALYLQKYIQYRKRKVFFGTTGKLSDLASVMAKHAVEKYLIIVSDVHNEDLLDQFTKHKLKVDKAVMYRTVSNDFTEEESFNYDMLVFFSPAGIAALQKNFPDYEQGETVIGCLGANTAQAARGAGLRIDIEAPTPQYPSITMAIDAYLKENHKRVRK